MVNYTILAHDNFNDEWKLMTLDSANISICDSRPPLSIEHVQNAIAFVKSEEERKRQLELDRVQKENESFEQFAAHIDEHMPHGTKAVIIAERVGNDSNSLEDYYGSISLDCVIVGWSSHNRNLFPEMRKAAKRFAPVEHLAELPKDMEHKRSYGSKRAFLKESSNEYADGWMVYKINLFDAGARYIPQSAQICPALLPDADVNTNQPVQVHARSSSGFSVKDLLI
ncbi:hypothetical protein [Alteromonas sp. 14N.309.X.WAT.G.H12]|uniref:hypothetical protein n=1 Tax=Alteromonas sp. 14N.309.X.WAT.G.H12 TaxID=3120824 RepID=UPI002FD77648